jgi:hypothetical protein
MSYLDPKTANQEADTDAAEVEEQEERRDLLADLDTVLRGSASPRRTCPPCLWDLAPDYKPYRGLTGVKLRALLEREHHIKVPSTGNRYPHRSGHGPRTDRRAGRRPPPGRRR